MKILNYRILLRKEPEGGYTVIVPTLPGCVTYGESIEHGIEMARVAIELYLESLREHGENY
ncbi:MAG: type II toxin-antitoxin system HicB family antitoxin [Candidatus Marinimicrobia bacterium]|nr:type II toxin-antitoxin system HicB family antitoxin [Candidatus Neomarinimicrobiota bacterium]